MLGAIEAFFIQRGESASMVKQVMSGAQPPRRSEWKSFALFLCSAYRGRKGNGLAPSTIGSSLACAVSAYARRTNGTGKLSPFERQQLVPFVLQEAADAGISIAEEADGAQAILSFEDLCSLVFAAYAEPRLWRHSRERLQVLAVVLLAAYGGARPGEATLSPHYLEDKCTLQWRDIDLALRRARPELAAMGHTVEIVTQTTIRNIKGKRTSKVTKVLPLYQEPAALALDLSVIWFALAIMDDIFVHDVSAYTVEDLPEDGSPLLLEEKDASLSRPVLRAIDHVNGKKKLDQDAVVVSDRPAKLDVTSDALKRLSEAAGFVEPVSAQTIRRDALNLLDHTCALATLDEERLDGAKHVRIDMLCALCQPAQMELALERAPPLLELDLVDAARVGVRQRGRLGSLCLFCVGLVAARSRPCGARLLLGPLERLSCTRSLRGLARC